MISNSTGIKQISGFSRTAFVASGASGLELQPKPPLEKDAST
jgi:hypothetical protein